METHRLALAAGYRLEQFQIVRILGKGGFGITYEAIDLQLSKKVAIKELLPDSIATRVEGSTVVPQTTSMEESWGWAKERFLEEARFLAGFSHPAIVGVHRLIEANGTVYMVMDFVEGESYEARLRRIGKEPDQASLMAVMGPILEGIEEIHAKNLLHRDIKPDNILIDKRGKPVLIDFGSARMSVGATMTMTSMVTHGYSPIEQYQTKGRMGPWTDIYAIGAVMCRAITGEKPPVAADRVIEDDFQWVSNRKPGGYDETFLNAVDWALRVRVEDRPQSIAAFAEHIRSKPNTPTPPPLPTTPPISAETASTPIIPNPKQEKNPNIKGIVVLFIAILVPLFYFLGTLSNRSSTKSSEISAKAEAATKEFIPENVAKEKVPEPTGQIIHVPRDYLTIGAALATAQPGQTVLVAPGVYEECVVLKSGVRLEGQKWDTTIIRNRSTPSPVVYANGISSASISNFTILQLLEQTGTNRYGCIRIENSSITVQSCYVQSSGHGIEITGSGNSQVLNCLAKDCAWTGIYVYANTGRANVVGNSCNGNGESGICVDNGHADLSDNTCSENKAWGIYFGNGSKGKVDGNTCNGNTIGGLAFRGSSTQVDIMRNVANNNGGYGIAVETSCHPSSFESNSASSNKFEPQVNRLATWND